MSSNRSEFSVAFIGAGNMAYSIVSGLIEAGTDASRLRAADPSDASLDRLRALGLQTVGNDNNMVADEADVIVLAVKPQVMRNVCEALAPSLGEEQLVISIAAGIEAGSLDNWLGNRAAVVRCMPNTPSLLRTGASALFAADDLDEQRRTRATTIMSAVGTVCWVQDEALLHAVTALSGSGPAYFFLFMEAMIEEAQRMGLAPETARDLCAQTCIGAGRMVAAGEDAQVLRRRVCSPGGTTERAVAAFQEGIQDIGLETLVQHAMRACFARSEEMARELSG